MIIPYSILRYGFLSLFAMYSSITDKKMKNRLFFCKSSLNILIEKETSEEKEYICFS